MSKFDTALKKYIDIFLNQEMYFVNDLKNTALFAQLPNNTEANEIRMKLSAMNDKEIGHHALLEEVIQHILHLNVDERIQQGDLSVVEDIASLTAHGKSYHLLAFASAFCNLHKPEAFPVYSNQHEDFYKRYIKEQNLSLDPEKINTYEVFSKALNDLVQRLGLTGKMNYLQLRKFGWLYAETVVNETNT